MHYPSAVVFPLHYLDLNERTRQFIHDELHAVYSFEEFDSYDVDERQWVRLIDCLGREVNLQIELMREFRSLKLVEIEPREEAIEWISSFTYIPPSSAWPLPSVDQRESKKPWYRLFE